LSGHVSDSVEIAIRDRRRREALDVAPQFAWIGRAVQKLVHALRQRGRVADGDAVFSPRLAGFVLDAFSGAIEDGSGTVALTKTGSGDLYLTGTNTYSGGTTISAGTLYVGSWGSSGGSSTPWSSGDSGGGSWGGGSSSSSWGSGDSGGGSWSSGSSQSSW